MNFPPKLSARGSRRSSKGALYTVCFASFVVPCVIALGNTLLQAGLCFYNQEKLDFVANEVIGHFESVSDLNESKFDFLYSDLAAANSMQLSGIKSEISSSADLNEEALQIRVSGRFRNDLGIMAACRPFVRTYKIPLSQFETYGYAAINAYPYCEYDPTRGLSAYMPIYRPSPKAPIWIFQQDTAIGGVHKAVCDNSRSDDQKPANWKDLAPGLVSIY